MQALILVAMCRATPLTSPYQLRSLKQVCLPQDLLKVELSKDQQIGVLHGCGGVVVHLAHVPNDDTATTEVTATHP